MGFQGKLEEPPPIVLKPNNELEILDGVFFEFKIGLEIP